MTKFDYFSIQQGHRDSRPGEYMGMFDDIDSDAKRPTHTTVLPKSRGDAGFAAVPRQELPSSIPQRVTIGILDRHGDRTERATKSFLTATDTENLKKVTVSPIRMRQVSPDKSVGDWPPLPPQEAVFKEFVGELRRLPDEGVETVEEVEEAPKGIPMVELKTASMGVREKPAESPKVKQAEEQEDDEDDEDEDEDAEPVELSKPVEESMPKLKAAPRSQLFGPKQNDTTLIKFCLPGGVVLPYRYQRVLVGDYFIVLVQVSDDPDTFFIEPMEVEVLDIVYSAVALVSRPALAFVMDNTRFAVYLVDRKATEARNRGPDEGEAEYTADPDVAM